MSARGFGLLTVAWLAIGCASVPPPRVLAEADRLAASPRVLHAKEHARSAWSLAEGRRAAAHRAAEDGLLAHAQMIGEDALASYALAVDAARVAVATLREQAALAEVERAQAALAEVDAAQARAQADVDALELRLRVAREAEAPQPNDPTRGARDEARRAAARAMATEARLLCAATRLVAPPGAIAAAPSPPPTSAPEDPTAPGAIARDLQEAEARLTELEASLGAGPAPIDLATRTRAACLGALTRVRRAAAPPAKAAAGSADALLEELGAFAARVGGLAVERDERGVALVLRQVFERDAVRADAAKRLAEIDRVAAAHPGVPVAVVVHTADAVAPADEAAWRARGERVAAALGSVPSAKRVVVIAGNARPLVDLQGRDRAQNARVEIVFLTPEAL